jgi:hypothetical protein
VRDTVEDAINARFAPQYARAKDDRAHKLAEEIITLADAPIREDADGRLDSAEVNQRRLQVDARKWIASKMLPKTYGDRTHTEHSGTLTLADLLSAPSTGTPPATTEGAPTMDNA